MNDRNLTFVSLLVAIIGVCGLAVLTIFMEPTSMTMAAISGRDVGRVVVVNGTVADVSEKNNNLFFALSDIENGSGERLRLVYWKSDAMDNPDAYDLKIGDMVAVTGQIATYRGDLEIVVKKISKIS